jgi:hypothetical protein
MPPCARLRTLQAGRGIAAGADGLKPECEGALHPPPVRLLPLLTSLLLLACRCYLDAELLNALVLRRDCCSVSAVKALQVGPSTV